MPAIIKLMSFQLQLVTLHFETNISKFLKDYLKQTFLNDNFETQIEKNMLEKKEKTYLITTFKQKLKKQSKKNLENNFSN